MIRGSQFSSVAFEACGGDAPWFVQNRVARTIAPSTGPEVYPLVARGDCHPVIEANSEISLTLSYPGLLSDTGTNFFMTALLCDSDGTTASRCVITKNPSIGTREVAGATNSGRGTQLQGRGIHCVGGACSRIDGNGVAGLTSTAMSGARASFGVTFDNAGRLLVDGNRIDGVFAPTAANAPSWGLIGSAAMARIQNNVVFALNPASCCFALSVGGPLEIFSNYFAGAVSGARGTPVFKNNVFLNRIESDLPVDFDNNVLHASGTAPLAVFTIDSMSVEARTVAEIEALVGSGASGNIDATCPTSDFPNYRHLAGSPCIDAGSVAGAPTRDREGDLRDSLPDIGPDEYVP